MQMDELYTMLGMTLKVSRYISSSSITFYKRNILTCDFYRHY